MNDDDPAPLHAFAGYGIELEYMIVGRDALQVMPLADRLLESASGGGHMVERDGLGWSNELALHVVELKNVAPLPSLAPLAQAFQDEVRGINRLLAEMDARLMPGAMHPWMDPRSETRLWPHEHADIYHAYARIFDVHSHGWANLQSMHVNLPFADDAEFARLHAAIRLLLPLLPALAASSPIAEGRITGCADYRMRVYCDNADAIPSIAGLVVPETVATRAGYESLILQPMYEDIAQRDPQRILRQEWLNSRGAIARFDRNAIEIRVIDTQECPQADLAVAAAACAVVRMLYERGAHDLARQQEMPLATLVTVLHACIADAEQALVTDAAYLALLGFAGRRCTAGELWQHLIQEADRHDPAALQPCMPALRHILEQGPLARRILRAVGGQPAPARIAEVYRGLCACLQDGIMFAPD